MKIRTFLRLSTVLGLVVVIALGLTLVFLNLHVASIVAQSETTSDIRQGHSELLVLSYEYLADPSARVLEQWSLRLASFSSLLASFQPDDSSQLADLADLKAQSDTLQSDFDRITASYERTFSGTSAEAVAEENVRKVLSRSLLVKLSAMTATGGRLEQQVKDHLVSTQSQTMLVTGVLVGVLAAVLLLLSELLRRRLVRPIFALQRGAEAVGAGDLHYQVGSISKDEIGELTRAFDHMTADLRMITVSRDELSREVVERKEAEEELREANEYLDNLFNYANAPIIVWDPEFRITRFNRAFEELTGRKAEAVAGESLEILFPVGQVGSSVELIHETLTGERWETVEIPILHLDGSVRTVLWNSATLLASDGTTPVATIAQGQEITERKQAEAALRESEEQYRALFEGMLNGFAYCQMLFDEENRPVDFIYLAVNPAFGRLTGLEDVVGKPVSEVIPGLREASPELLESYGRVALTGRPEHFDFDFKSLDMWLSISVYSPHKGYFVAVFDDITDRTRAEQERLTLERQLQQSQKLESLGILAGGIAHDFNNILLAVLGNAELALTGLSPSAPARENLLEITQAARRATELCRQMLAYSGRGHFVTEPIDLRAIVEDLVGLLKSTISKKALLNLNLEKNLPPTYGDPSQISQVIMNLVLNASEAIGEKSGVITISTGAMECSREYLRETYVNETLAPGLYLSLEVSDTGSGMDAETQARLFEPFFTTKFTGRGLGLSAVLGIVRGHKGALKLYSELGKGTTFKILFPAAEAEAGAPLRKTGTPTAEWEGEGIVLLVDDEETIRALGARMLGSLGFQVLTAADGREALQLYTEHRGEIALVLLDLTMPHMDGEETFRELRRLDPGVRVVMSSGYTEQDITSRFAGKGLVGFVQKPYTLAQLAERLRAALEGSG